MLYYNVIYWITRLEDRACIVQILIDLYNNNVVNHCGCYNYECTNCVRFFFFSCPPSTPAVVRICLGDNMCLLIFIAITKTIRTDSSKTIWYL